MEIDRNKLDLLMDLTVDNIFSTQERIAENHIYEPLYKTNNKILYIIRGSFRTMSYQSVIEHHKKLSKKISKILEMDVEYLFIIQKKHTYGWNLTNNQKKLLKETICSSHISETIEKIIDGNKYYFFEYDSDNFDRQRYPEIQIDVLLSEFILNCLEEIEFSKLQFSYLIETRPDCISNIYLETIDLEKIYVMYDLFIMCSRKNYDLVKSLKLMVDHNDFSHLISYFRENKIWFGDYIYYKTILNSFGIEPTWLENSNIFVRPYGSLIPFPCHEISEELIQEVIIKNEMCDEIYLHKACKDLDVVNEIAVYDLNDFNSELSGLSNFFNKDNIYPSHVYKSMCENFKFNSDFIFHKHIKTYIKLFTFFHKAYSEKNYKATVVVNNTIADCNFKLACFIKAHEESEKIVICSDFIFIPSILKAKFYFITHQLLSGNIGKTESSSDDNYFEIYKLIDLHVVNVF